jgi:hypothetical protein
MSPKSPKEIRLAAGLSLDKVAARADVSGPTARIYEIDPKAVKDARKRDALARTYAALEERVAASAG